MKQRIVISNHESEGFEHSATVKVEFEVDIRVGINIGANRKTIRKIFIDEAIKEFERNNRLYS